MTDRAATGDRRAARLHGDMVSRFEAVTLPLHERLFRFGPHVIRLKFAGPALAPIYFRALAHLSVEDSSKEDATIHVWDGAATGIDLPPPPWRTEDFCRKALVPGLSDARFTTLLLRTARGIASVDRLTRSAYLWIPSFETLPWWEQAAPLRIILDVLGQTFGLVLLHAAAVGHDGRGLLIAGPGGSGKSTIALECLKQGMDYVGDDYCVLGSGYCFSLYGTAKKKTDDVLRLPWFSSLPKGVRRTGNGKVTLFVNEVWPERIARQLEIAALLTTRFTDAQRPSTTPITAKTALTRMAPSTLVQSEAQGRLVLAGLKALVTEVPAYELAVPAAVEAVPPFLRSMIDQFTAQVDLPSVNRGRA